MGLAIRAALLAAGAAAAFTPALASASGTRSYAPTAPTLDPSRFAELASGVVLVRAFNCGGTATEEGSGFLVGRRVVMTARHVVTGSCELKVDAGGRWVWVKSWNDWTTTGESNGSAEDLATLRLSKSAAGHIFSIRSVSPPVGTNLAAIGHPLGNELSVTQGPVVLRIRRNGVPYVAVRLLAAEGGSGSPLVDDAGSVAGILQIGYGSKDIIGQNTAGLVVGIDLGAWWGNGRAQRDLCGAYPAGGIPSCSGSAPKPAPKPRPTPKPQPTTTATGSTVPFYRAYVLYPGSIFDNPVTRSYPDAQGSVTVIPGSCLVSLTGLHAGAQYNVFLDPNAVPNESASAVLSGPWQQLGTFAASSGGVGTYTCTQEPPKGSILDINAEPQDLAILFSGQIP